MTNPKFVVAGLPPPGWMLLAWAYGVAFVEGPGRWVMLWPCAVYLFTCYAYAFDGDFGAAAVFVFGAIDAAPRLATPRRAARQEVAQA